MSPLKRRGIKTSPAKRKRISFRIKLPSTAFSQFLKETIFDPNAFRAFTENPKGVLEARGVMVDASVTEDVLTRLRFTIIRARNFVVKEKVTGSRFEEIFGRYENIFAVREDSEICVETRTDTEPDTTVEHGSKVTVGPQASFAVEYSEQSSETNRGADTSWEGQDAVANSHSDHWSTTKFEGERIAHLKDRFARVPLLDAITLGRLMAQFHIRLKEFGNY